MAGGTGLFVYSQEGGAPAIKKTSNLLVLFWSAIAACSVGQCVRRGYPERVFSRTRRGVCAQTGIAPAGRTTRAPGRAFKTTSQAVRSQCLHPRRHVRCRRRCGFFPNDTRPLQKCDTFAQMNLKILPIHTRGVRRGFCPRRRHAPCCAWCASLFERCHACASI